MKVRPPEPHETDAARFCEEAAFSVHLAPAWRERFAETVDSGAMRIAVEDDEVVGTFAALPVEMTLPGGQAAVVGAVTAVAVLPTHRRRGVLRSLMATCLEEAHGRGEALSVLYASEGAIYGRFGYGPASWSASYRIERTRSGLAGAALEGIGGRVVMLESEEAAEAMPAVFDAARKRRVGEVERLAAWWAGLTEQTPGAREPSARFFACYEQDGRIDGYAVYEVGSPEEEAFPRRELQLVELLGASEDAERALWGFVLGVDLVGAVVTGRRPVDDPLRLMLDNPRALEVRELGDHTWLRLVDLPVALAQRRYDAPGTLVFEVTDGDCSWNAGRWRLEVGTDGSAEVSRSQAAPDLSCGTAALASAYLGGTTWHQLAAGRRVAAASPAALALADRLFACRAAPFCTADF
ncbi:MAG: Enhanced intracellular survival protein [Acidimicrobiaceae bacterium]|nr:Enhanced intracellular survival protein [Acidimicrobiaceae bacterium]